MVPLQWSQFASPSSSQVSCDVTGHQGCSDGTHGRDCFSKWSVHCRFCVSLFSLSPSNTLSLSLCLSSTTCLSGGSLVTLTSWPFTTLWTWSTCSTVTALSLRPRPCEGPADPNAPPPACCVARASAFRQHQTKNKIVHTHNIERATLSACWHMAAIRLNPKPFSKWRRVNLWRCSCWPWLLWIGFFFRSHQNVLQPCLRGGLGKGSHLWQKLSYRCLWNSAGLRSHCDLV